MSPDRAYPIGSMVLLSIYLYMVCHGSHQSTLFMLPYIPAPWIRHGYSILLPGFQDLGRWEKPTAPWPPGLRLPPWILRLASAEGQGANDKARKSAIIMAAQAGCRSLAVFMTLMFLSFPATILIRDFDIPSGII